MICIKIQIKKLIKRFKLVLIEYVQHIYGV